MRFLSLASRWPVVDELHVEKRAAPFALTTRVEDVGVFPMINVYFTRTFPDPLSRVPADLLMGSISLKIAQTNKVLWLDFVKLMARAIEHMCFEVLGETISFEAEAAAAVMQRSFE